MADRKDELEREDLELKQRQNEELRRKAAKRETNRVAIIIITIILIIAWYAMK